MNRSGFQIDANSVNNVSAPGILAQSGTFTIINGGINSVPASASAATGTSTSATGSASASATGSASGSASVTGSASAKASSTATGTSSGHATYGSRGFAIAVGMIGVVFAGMFAIA